MRKKLPESSLKRDVGFQSWLLLTTILFLLSACDSTTTTSSISPIEPTKTASILSTATPTPQPSPTATATHRVPTRTPTATSQSTTTVTVWVNLSPSQTETLLEDIDAFEIQFPQYTIRLREFDRPENFVNQVVTDEAEFDVVLASPSLLSSLWVADQLAPMSDFFPPSFLDAFIATALQGSSADEELWGLPDTAGFHLLLFYNRDLVETPPANLDDLAEVAETLTTSEQWGLGVNSYDPLWLLPWTAGEGGWFAEDNVGFSLNSAAVQQALTIHQTWHLADEPIAPLMTHAEMQDEFVAGEMAMMIDGEWALNSLSQVPELSWGVVPLPILGEANDFQTSTPLVLGRYWAISRDVSGDRALAASAFLEFVTQPERQLRWTARYNQLPTRRQALTNPQIFSDPILRISATQMQSGQALPLGIDANLVLDAMRGPLRQMLEGALTPKEAVELMEENVAE